MKQLKTFVIAVLFLTLVSGNAFAHDQEHHKGKPTEGVVVSVVSESFELATEDKSYTIIVDEKTKFEMGDKKVGREQLTKDSKVKVFGTKLPGGKIAASEVLIEKSSSHGKDTNPDGHH